MTRQQSTKSLKVIGIMLLVHALLVATHEGEFWPFSIYPMFSQAGNPWSSALILDVSKLEDSKIWEEQPYPLLTDDLVVPLAKTGVDQIDYANFVTRTTEWTHSRQMALYYMFGPEILRNKKWLVVIVHGKLTENGSVESYIEPLILLTEDEIRLKNSELPLRPF